ncbi:MAG: hypothetical protein AAFR16_05595, partial [Pseudomonadota bacterium]
ALAAGAALWALRAAARRGAPAPAPADPTRAAALDGAPEEGVETRIAARRDGGEIELAGGRSAELRLGPHGPGARLEGRLLARLRLRLLAPSRRRGPPPQAAPSARATASKIDR